MQHPDALRRQPVEPSPHGRLACRQVRRHWYGRLLYLPAAAFLWSTRLPGLRVLAGSRLNPYLVLAIGRY